MNDAYVMRLFILRLSWDWLMLTQGALTMIAVVYALRYGLSWQLSWCS